MKYSKILGTGGYLPETIRTNAELEQYVDTSDEWIVERTGISERRIAKEGETASQMGTLAAQRALQAAQIDAQQIDLIVVATSSPDRIFPSTACLIQNQLGIAGCGAMDVQAACAGFAYALSVADQYVRSGAAKHALVIGTECNSRIIDWTDRSTCIIFGDGAGAVVLGQSEEGGILSTHIHADGQYQDLLYVPNPLKGQERTPNERSYMVMKG
ncbi:MAG TPA: 3-oxoacyl-ACP synthase, partial [Gammaproteobacteria bacterium]|nr:3-oxoacyl-ACP synthase [Gammaproteobacteria bacterium]